MKIAMITPDSYMIDRRIILEAKALIREGHKVTLLAGFECIREENYIEEEINILRYVYDWDDERLKKIRDRVPNNDKLKMIINRVFIIIAKKILYLNPFEMFMAKRLMDVEADVIHVHDLPCLKVGYYVAHKKNIPLVYDAHELYYAQDVLSKKQQKFYYKLEKKYIRKATQVITVNQFIAKLMAKRYNIHTPNVIMNCTDESELLEQYQTDDIIRAQYGLSKEDRIVLYQGWISPERNIESLVRSVKHLPHNIYLVIVGYGDYQKKLQEICKKDCVEDRVIFVGEVANKEIIKYTACADIGVIPYEPIDDNHLYCSPNKLFEYIVGELPIITNKLPFFEYIREKYGVLVTTEMKKEKILAQDIINNLTDAEELNLLKENCRKAKKILNWSEESKKLSSIYRELI